MVQSSDVAALNSVISPRLSDAVLDWLLYPRVTIKTTLRDELFDLSCRLANASTDASTLEALRANLLSALDDLLTAAGHGGFGRESIGEHVDFSVIEVDHVQRMREMHKRAPYFGKVPLDKVALPSDHPVYHASVTVYITYMELLAKAT